MRDAAQITRTPREYLEYQSAERKRNLREVMAILRHARETRAEWYQWIVDGKPTLTDAEYARVAMKRRKR